MEFKYWKKEILKVHKGHQDAMITLHNPKASAKAKFNAAKRLEDLKPVEMNLENMAKRGKVK